MTPEDGAAVPRGTPVRFSGQGDYLEEDAPELERLVWTSSIDGRLGEGGVLMTRSLSAGRHRITLAACSGKRIGRAEISMTAARESKRSGRGRRPIAGER